MKQACVSLALTLIAVPALAQNVEITPIGSHPGELCANDRATIFEDPTGVRILYDVAHNLTAADDSRVGDRNGNGLLDPVDLIRVFSDCRQTRLL